jgi:DNA-binding helix-hairpin-helix protein with protein kinase domain
MKAAVKEVILLNGKGNEAGRVRLGSEIHRGGAGAVYRLDSMPGRVLKVYHSATLSKEGRAYQAKVIQMVAQPPVLPPVQLANGETWARAAWPEASAFAPPKTFVGFTMPSFEGRAVLLENVMNDKHAAQQHLRPLELEERIRVSASLAEAAARMHDAGYAIVDMKPENIYYHPLVHEVALLDCDGFFVRGANGRVYEAPQVTPEYHAPEFASGSADVNADPETQDHFALAVIIFRLLNHGVHPFSGVPAVQTGVPDDIAGRIRGDFYAYGRAGHKKLKPAPGSIHESFPKDIRTYFDAAFGPRRRRPSARDWADLLAHYLDMTTGLIEPCSTGGYHHHRFTETECAICALVLQRTSVSVAPRTSKARSSTPAAHAPAAAPARRTAPARAAAPARAPLPVTRQPALGFWKLLLNLAGILATALLLVVILSTALGAWVVNRVADADDKQEAAEAAADAPAAATSASPVVPPAQAPVVVQNSATAPMPPPKSAESAEVKRLRDEATQCAESYDHACVVIKAEKILAQVPGDDEARLLLKRAQDALRETRDAVTID